MNWIAAGEFQEIGEGRRGQACVTGQAILSRTALEEPAVIAFTDQATAKWRWNPAQPRRGARMALRARTAGVVVYSVHLESGGNPDRRSRQMADITADAGVVSPALVAGDFNAAPWSHTVRDLAERAELRLVRRGLDLTKTFYPFPGFGLPLDHVLVSEAWRVLALEYGPPGGSDHAPLIVDLRLGPEA